jgi:histidinol-phosphate/aromatic aminotransferase/cobyric acid decarboxylase-like protein
LARALGIAPEDVLDLSASLNPMAPDVAAVASRHLGALRRYPDPGAATAALATALGVAPERLLLTNGGAEAIALVASALGAGWVDEPDFSLYRRHLPHLDPNAPRWRSNPHNPTGRCAPAGEHADVWDEAFYPLATGRWTSGAAERGSIVLGSLTKLFGCPGLRIGYVLVPGDRTELAVALGEAQPQWSVNSLALAVLPELLAAADLPGWAAAVAARRADLVGVLGAYGLAPLPSDANYVLVPEAAFVRGPLASRGVLVRDCASFGWPDHIRVAVPDEAGLARLAAALASTVGSDARR